MRKIQLYGRSINGRPFISGLERYNQFFLENDGARIFIEMTAMEPETNQHHCWYIMKMIVPAFIEGYKNNGSLLTPQQAIEEIIVTCPIFHETDKTFHTFFDFGKFEAKSNLSRQELELAIEWLHMYCLDNFNITIGNFKSI